MTTKKTLSPEEFVSLWQRSATLADVAEAAHMEKRTAIDKAAHLRSIGVKLKRFQAKKEKIDVAKLNEIVKKSTGK